MQRAGLLPLALALQLGGAIATFGATTGRGVVSAVVFAAAAKHLVKDSGQQFRHGPIVGPRSPIVHRPFGPLKEHPA